MYSGQIIAHFVSTAIITAVVSITVLWFYRSTVMGHMSTGGSAEIAVPPLRPRPRSSEHVPHDTIREWERRLRCRVMAGVVAAALISAIPIANLTARDFDGYVDHRATLTLALIGPFAIAAVPMVASLLALSWRWAFGFGAMLLMMLAAATAATPMVQGIAIGMRPSPNQFLNAVLFLNLTALEAASPLLLLLTTGFARVRGIAPMVAVGLLIFSLAPLSASQLIRVLTTSPDWGPLVFALGRTTWTILLALPAGWLAWLSLNVVAQRFGSKRISESELLANVWWVLFVAARGIEHTAARGWSWTTLGVGCGVCLVFAVLFRRLLKAAMPVPRPPKRTLLVLRVFDDEARTARVFDRVALRWRWLGPVMTIDAPDLSARTVDPLDFLALVSGRLQARFVKSVGDLEEGLAHLDVEPDPDGRFRVNKLCCQADTWRAAVVSLIERADAVVMDLRNFSTKREGCTFELRQLGQRLNTGRVVLTVDDTTDRELLAACLGASAAPSVMELRRNRVTDRDLSTIYDAAVAAAYTAHTPRPTA